jgi:hypothetical protein
VQRRSPSPVCRLEPTDRARAVERHLRPERSRSLGEAAWDA